MGLENGQGKLGEQIPPCWDYGAVTGVRGGKFKETIFGNKKVD